MVKHSNGSDKCFLFCLFNEKILSFFSSEIRLTLGVMLERWSLISYKALSVSSFRFCCGVS